MLKSNNSTIKSNSFDSKISGTVNIKAGSFVIDNQWVSYDSYLFRIVDYINSLITNNRPTFFKDRNNALNLIVTLSLQNGITIVEGPQVKYTIRESVPIPMSLENIPLVGVTIRHDGTNNLNSFIPVTDIDIRFFSGTGNIENKNLMGITGVNSNIQGFTGTQGEGGITGVYGSTGFQGGQGTQGFPGALIQGATGVQGMTGISWDIHLPFDLTNR